jgi:hypothetical protein
MKQRAFLLVLKICPPALLPLVLRLISRPFFWRYRADEKSILKQNEALKNTQTGKTAYILATGPSMKALDLARLVGKDCFSVSNFYLHKTAKDIAPKYHFIAPYHPPLVYEEYVCWLKDMDKNLPAKTAIVLGLETRQTIVNEQVFKERPVHYLGLQKAQITSGIDLTKTVMKPQSSPLMVLPFVHYLGYSRVVLIGCDHNILKDYGGTVSNFYAPGKDPRNNATTGDNWQAGIVKHLEFALNIFKQYQFYNHIFNKSGRKLVHTSPNGWLDFLPYESFEDAVD